MLQLLCVLACVQLGELVVVIVAWMHKSQRSSNELSADRTYVL